MKRAMGRRYRKWWVLEHNVNIQSPIRKKPKLLATQGSVVTDATCQDQVNPSGS
jgi:hypothetical protein